MSRKKGKKGRKAQSESQEPVHSIDCPQEPVHSIDCPQEPVHSIDCPQEPVHSIDCLKEPVHSIDCPQEPVHSINCLKEPVHFIDCAQETVHSIDCLKEPVHFIDCAQETVHSIDCLKEPVHFIDCLKETVHFIGCPEEPIITLDCAEEPVVTLDCAQEPVHFIDCAQKPVHFIDCAQESVHFIGCPEEPVVTLDCAEEPVNSIDCPEEPVITLDCAEEPVNSIDCAEEPVVTLDCAEEPVNSIDCPEEPVVTLDCAEEPVYSIDCAEKPVLCIDGTEEPVHSIDCSKDPVVSINCADEPALALSAAETAHSIDCVVPPSLTVHHTKQEEKAKTKKKKWSLKKRKKGMKAKPVSQSANCLEEPGLTLTCAEQALHLITDCPEETSALNINCFGEKPVAVAAGCIEKPTLSIGCVEKPVLSIACLEKPAVSICCREKPVVSIDSGDYTLHNTEKQRLKFQSFKKFQAENISQDDTQKSRIDHTALGFPNIGNTCYMNATLQSLFSLLTFIQDIKREESCWRPNLTTHLLKCLADLHAARASRSRELKICLLKTLKRSVASNFSDFWGDEQQDAHEFFSILLSQLKEEGVSLRTRMGLHSYTCAIEANFEFELLSTRKCLRCGKKVCNTESYNCLSVDLVPGGSVQDCLALYFKGYEVECRCQWCCGELASVEQTLQSVPRVLVVQLKRFSLSSRGHLVKLHDRLLISPQLSLQAHSRANVRLPGMPKTHQTHGDCLDTSPLPGGAVCFTADKKSSVKGSPPNRVDQDSYAVNEYKITSVLSHIGSSMQHGHYICESTDGNTNWLSFDDERVKQMDQRSVLRQRANSAYLLFYEYRGAGGER